MARSYSDPQCRVGVILGTGTNACYLERISAIPKWKSTGTGSDTGTGTGMVINMEWGGFGSQAGSTALPLTSIDNAIDASSPNVGQQRYEKMISGMYLGEMVRLLALEAWGSGAAGGGGSKAAAALSSSGGAVLESKVVGAGIADESSDLSSLDAALRSQAVPVETTLDERRLLADLCTLVMRRAARLTCAGLAAVMHQMGTDGSGVTVGIDGSVYQANPKFQQWMRECLGELGVKCSLVNAEDGSGLGAALVALTASSGGAIKVRTGTGAGSVAGGSGAAGASASAPTSSS